ncbi:amidohydrolase family protein [Planktotalea arctica]|uniref:amidohydrolase family protein n=1 Tax=Planktotalea arctica TaxID=1481893 RepID=UPI000A16CFFE|nr:amidohydrolase family protein [Planktotalea arctica]
MDKPDAIMPPPAQKPLVQAPVGACDAHVHLVAAMGEFDLWEARAENPARFDDTEGPDLDGWLALWRKQLDALGFSRGVIVHSILYGADNSVTVEAVRRMGEGFKGVGLLSDGACEGDVAQMAEWNMAAVRLNYVHGGVLSWGGVQAMAPMLKDHGMHVQMLMHAHQHMDALADDVRALPVDICFDHIGWPDLGLGAKHDGVQKLCQLLNEGKTWVKLSALYRMCAAPYDAADEIVAALVAANPERCLWGSDWPHLMLADAQMPIAAELLDAFHRVVTDDATRHRILVSNPAALYGF